MREGKKRGRERERDRERDKERQKERQNERGRTNQIAEKAKHNYNKRLSDILI